MTDLIDPPEAQFLRENVVRGGMDLLLFAHKSHLNRADEALDALGLGRAHHRALYFIHRKPDVSIADLLLLLGVTKQSLSRVLRLLIDRGYVRQRVGDRDRRQRLLALTQSGEALETSLFLELRENMARAYTASGPRAVKGYWTLMQNLMSPATQRQFAAFYQDDRP